MAEWRDPKSDYVAGDQVTPEIFNTLAENEKFLKENDYKVLNVYNTDNNGTIVNHYLIEAMEK